MYIINKLHHGKCFCTIFTHSFVFTKLTCSQSLTRSFRKNKLGRTYYTSLLPVKKSIYFHHQSRQMLLKVLMWENCIRHMEECMLLGESYISPVSVISLSTFCKRVVAIHQISLPINRFQQSFYSGLITTVDLLSSGNFCNMML